jgi:6-phosphogluconolactonase
VSREQAIRLVRASDPKDLALQAAEWLTSTAEASTGVFAVALSGGSTPQRLYECLARPPFLARFPWPRARWFWGDERFVAQGDALSNFRMTREAMLSVAPVPATNIHAVATGLASPADAASAYEQTLKSFYGRDTLDPARPLFDVTLLGLGTDGHTASLFPGTSVLDERVRWVAPVVGVKAEPRITLTYPALESSRNVAFLVSGEDKRAMLSRLRQGDRSIPAGRLAPAGSFTIFADAAALAD